MADLLKTKISKSYQDLDESSQYSVVVIGSGYGGSIVASRLARAGQNVCLLERGLEIRPGDYPVDLGSAQKQTQIHNDKYAKVLGKKTAMFDLRVNEDVSALVGCGLGGTSLINANVSLELTEGVFSRKRLEWPRVFRDSPDLLKDYYQLARQGLGANPYPNDPNSAVYKPLNKFAALGKSAKALGVEVSRPDINVNFQNKDNHFGFSQPECNLCGDCCSGCNVGAKNTTLMNYLPDAASHGADIFCNTTVEYVEKIDGGWKVYVHETEPRLATSKFIQAEVLILAAGTLGSTEIMLRSKEQGLACSDKLGQHFSGNGDVLAFGYNSYWRDNDEGSDALLRDEGAARYESIYGIGMGDNDVLDEQLPGPCITGLIDLRDHNKAEHQRIPAEQQLVIEEGVVPGAFSSLASATLMFGAVENANFLRYGAEQAQSRLEDIQELANSIQNDPTALGELSYKGALSRTQTYLVMGMDESVGKLKLKQGRIVIDWPNAGNGKSIKYDHSIIARANDAVQGQLIDNPMWHDAFGNKVITVHPLGGCRMADDHHNGVVNDKCQVFDCETDSSVYKGLYVCDGAVIPAAIGVNPLLTISAIAERCSELLAKEYGWVIDYQSRKELVEFPVAQEDLPDPEPTQIPVFPDLSNEETLSLFSLAGTGMLANRVTELRKERGEIYSSTKERDLWRLQGQVGTTILDAYDGTYKNSFTFEETMSGYMDASNNHKPETVLAKRDYLRAFAGGKGADNSVNMTLKIKVEDLSELIKDRTTDCTVTSCELKIPGRALTFKSGSFQLLVPNTDAVESWLMLYQMDFIEGDKPRLLIGRKTLRSRPGSHWWTDLTELSVDLFESVDGKPRQRISSGLVRLNLQDFIQQVSTFKTNLDDNLLQKMLGRWLYLLIDKENIETLSAGIGAYYLAKLAGSLAETVFRSYGGLLSNLANHPKQELADMRPMGPSVPSLEFDDIKTADGSSIKLTCYQAGNVGSTACLPVILAPGMGVKASSFATDTVDCNLVSFLNQKGRDVWLLDYRASADSGSSHRKFSVDDIACYDWPAAIDFVVKESGSPKVQIVAHCVGSLSLLMGLMAKHINRDNIQSIVSSQLGLHPVTSWLNNAKSDFDIIDELEEYPLLKKSQNVVDMNAGTTGFDRMFDIMSYQIPTPHGEECTNPTCHRILAIYGPSYLHSQLNHDTHVKMMDWFGRINLEPFKQMTYMIQAGYAVNAQGENTYLNGIDRPDANKPRNTIEQLDLPISFMVGSLNLQFLPQTSDRTYQWLNAHNPLSADKYRRHVFEGYGHMDCFIGKNADVDVFPTISEWLDAYNEP